MALGKGRSRNRAMIHPKLQITAMMDMFTIIMIFLLCSYSADPETLKLEKAMELPASIAEQEYDKNVILTLTLEELKLGDEVLGTFDGKKLAGLDPDALKSSNLYRKLRECREKADKLRAAEIEQNGAPADLAKSAAVGQKPKEHILFFCDKNHSFETINNVIKTAGMAGYPNLQFAVLEK
jgi:biopolymer transport protein ExbD